MNCISFTTTNLKDTCSRGFKCKVEGKKRIKQSELLKTHKAFPEVSEIKENFRAMKTSGIARQWKEGKERSHISLVSFQEDFHVHTTTQQLQESSNLPFLSLCSITSLFAWILKPLQF